MWIKAENAYIGKEGTFIGGQLYDVTPDRLRAIKADCKSSGKPEFKYEETVAPWLQGASQVRLDLESATNDLNTEQARLNKLRTSQDAMLANKAKVEAQLAELDKLKAEDLQKDPAKQRQFRRAKAKLEIAECDLEETAEAIKQAVDVTGKLAKKIEGLQKKLAAENKKKNNG